MERAECTGERRVELNAFVDFSDRWRERLKHARDICLDLSGFAKCSLLWLDLLIPPHPFTGIRKLILSEVSTGFLFFLLTFC